MVALSLLVALQVSSSVMFVRARVEQSCTLSVAGAQCSGARGGTPTMVRERGRVVYSF